VCEELLNLSRYSENDCNYRTTSWKPYSHSRNYHICM